MATTGECPHDSGYGYISPPVYPEQALLKPGQRWCHDCRSVVTDPDELARLHAAAQLCLRAGSSDCEGEVRARPSFAGTGTTIYECAGHMVESEERERQLRQRYPDIQPPDFDPSYAGESWYGDGDW